MKKALSYVLVFALLLTGMFYGGVAGDTQTVKAAEEYVARDPIYDMSDTSVNRMTSDHFQIIWGNDDTTGTVTEEFVRGNLENLEMIRSFYVDEMGFADIGVSQNSSITGKYKTNLYITATGLSKIVDDWAYMSVDADSFAYLVMAPGALRVDPPSWVVPHELAHAFTYHMGGSTPYEWYEAFANFCRNEYLQSTYYRYGDTVYGPTTDFFAPFVLNSESHFPHVKNWYDAWPILLYIEENPDNITGLGHDAILKLLSNNVNDNSFFDTVERITGVDIADILGGFERRMVTMDFNGQDSYQNYLSELLATDSANYAKIYTTLESMGDGWLKVPDDKAPQQTGYNIVPLDVDYSKASLTVDFQTLSTATDADYRISIVTTTSTGDTRYSSMWSNGSNSINLKGDEVGAYLVVSATPTTIQKLTIEEDGATYPYKVQITQSDSAIEETPSTDTLSNIAESATVTTSFCSSWETVTAVNDGVYGNTSAETGISHYGTWGNASSYETVTYTWDSLKEISAADLYIWNDGGGILTPSYYTYEYLKEDGTWAYVNYTSGYGNALDTFNTTNFDTVTTTAIRLTLYKQATDSNGVGIVEWKVYGKDYEVNTENYATSATVTTSFCSSWETVTAVNDGVYGSTSAETGISHYGTWGNTSSYETVTYTWDTAKKISRSEIYFWNDGGGILTPSSYKYEYLHANGSWVEVSNASGYGLSLDTFNTTTFDTVSTTAIRVTIHKQSNDSNGIGLVEWSVK